MREKLSAGADLLLSTTRTAEGRLSAGAGKEPLEQTMYRGLAAYRLSSTDKDFSGIRAASLTALLKVLPAYAHLTKAVRIEGFVPTPALAYSPDGRSLAAGGENGLIVLLDASDSREIGRLDCGQKPKEAVWTLAFNSDGTRLAAGYLSVDSSVPGSGRVCVFDVAQRSVLRAWSSQQRSGQPSDVYSVAYGGKPGTEFVASAGSDKMLRVLEVATGMVRESLQKEEPVGLAVSADGRTIASGGMDGILRIWNLASFDKPGVRATEFEGHQGTIQMVAFAPTIPSLLVSAGDDGRVMVWNVDKECCTQQTKQQPARIYGVAVSPETPKEPFIAAAEADGLVRLFSLSKANASCPASPAKGKPAAEPPEELEVIPDGVLLGHGGAVLAVAYNPDGSRLASAGQDGSIRLWGAKTGGFSRAQLDAKSTGITTVAISPDGALIAAGDEKGDLHLWDRPQDRFDPVKQDAFTWSAHGKPIRSVVFVQIGNRIALVSGGDDGVIKRWDASSRTMIGPEMADEAHPVQSMAVSPDGRILAAGSSDGSLRLWELATGARLRRFEKGKTEMPQHELYSVGFSGDGKYLAVGDNEGGLRLLDVQGGSMERRLLGQNSIKSFAHGRTRWLLSAGDDGSAIEWEQGAVSRPPGASLKQVEEFKFRMGFRGGLDPKPLSSIGTSEDGGLILTGGEGGQVHLWDGVEPVLIGEVLGHGKEAVRAVAVAPDGTFFVTADASTILFWPGPDRWADILCSKVDSNMTREQWDKWVSPKIPQLDPCGR